MNKLSAFTCLLFALALSACCTKKACVNSFDQNTISMVGFLASELDSMLVSSYEQGSNFSSAPLQTVSRSATEQIDNASYTSSVSIDVFLDMDLVPELDYRIEIPNLNLTYDVTAIVMEEKKCNTCFLKSDNFFDLANYQVNGQLVTGYNLQITR